MLVVVVSCYAGEADQYVAENVRYLKVVRSV